MQERMKEIVENFKKYNSQNMAETTFGLDPSLEYDALVVAPGWKPTKLLSDDSFRITTLATHSYISGYLVEKDGLRIAWIQTASSASNLIDHLSICAELKFKKLIFIGAVGALKEDFSVGDLCTPEYCISGVFANTYLKKSLKDFIPFEKVYPDAEYIDRAVELLARTGIYLKKGSVFCTDSVALEYSHLAEIKSFDTELIEMETSSFYLLAKLLEVPAIALLIVSDNSATNQPLVGKMDAQEEKYNYGRKQIIPKAIYQIAKNLD